MTMAGSTVVVGNLVAYDLIENGDAEISELEPYAAKTTGKNTGKSKKVKTTKA